MDAKMRQPFQMKMMIANYFKNMSTYQYTLALLGNLLDNAKMIWLCLVQFLMDDELNKLCEKWEDLPVNTCTYADFRWFIIKQIIWIDNQKRTLGTTKITNLVNESTKQSTKVLLGELLVQVETICQLIVCFDKSEGNSGALFVISAQDQAM